MLYKTVSTENKQQSIQYCLNIGLKVKGRLYKNVVKVNYIVSVKLNQSESRILASKREISNFIVQNIA